MDALFYIYLRKKENIEEKEEEKIWKWTSFVLTKSNYKIILILLWNKCGLFFRLSL